VAIRAALEGNSVIATNDSEGKVTIRVYKKTPEEKS